MMKVLALVTLVLLVKASCFNQLSPNSSVEHKKFRNFREAQAHGIANALIHHNFGFGDAEHPELLTVDGNFMLPLPPPGPGASPGAPGRSNDDPKLLQKRALQFWIQKEFFRFYEKYSSTLTPQEITDAYDTFNKYKLASYPTTGSAGVLLSLLNDELKPIIDWWVTMDLISSTDAENIKRVIDGSGDNKPVKDYGHKSRNGDLILKRIGYISTQIRTDDPPSGTLIYLFRKFRFNRDMILSVVDGQECQAWGMFCTNTVIVQTPDRTLSGSESKNLGNYMKHEVAQLYDTQISPFIQYLKGEADRYAQYLPAEFKDDWDKINAQPDVDPALVLPRKNAFDPKNYHL